MDVGWSAVLPNATKLFAPASRLVDCYSATDISTSKFFLKSETPIYMSPKPAGVPPQKKIYLCNLVSFIQRIPDAEEEAHRNTTVK